jgi:hypothetical protein
MVKKKIKNFESGTIALCGARYVLITFRLDLLYDIRDGRVGIDWINPSLAVGPRVAHARNDVLQPCSTWGGTVSAWGCSA